MNSRRFIYRIIFSHARKYSRQFALGFVLTLVSTIFSVASPLLVKKSIECMYDGTGTGAVFYLASALFLFGLARSVLIFLGRRRIILGSRQIERDLRNTMFSHIVRTKQKDIEKYSSGELVSRTINDIDNIRLLFGFGIMIVVNTFLIAVMSSVVMFNLDSLLASLSLCSLLLLSLLVLFCDTEINKRSTQVQETLSKMSAFSQETFSGIRTVKGYTREEYLDKKFRAICDENLKRNLQLAHIRGIFDAGSWLIVGGLLATTLYIGFSKIHAKEITQGTLVAFVAYQLMLVWPMMALGYLVVMIQRALACADRLAEILQLPVEEKTGDVIPTPDGNAAITVKNLTFGFDGNNILQNVSFTIRTGEKVAIVGPVGSGKSVLLSLFLRLYNTPPGTVFLYGKDVTEIDLDLLRKHFSSALQDNFLFSGRISENLEIATHAPLTDRAVEQALDRAVFLREVKLFKEGIHQEIGERGITLSGGQRQRLAIARALTMRAPIILLDNVFSSVDSQTENEIVSNIKNMSPSVTVIAVTHRLTTLPQFDRVIVIDQGRVAEEGKPQELMAAGGRLTEMMEQFRILSELGFSDAVKK